MIAVIAGFAIVIILLIIGVLWYQRYYSGPQPRADMRCGPSYEGAKCGSGICCSKYGWCGTDTHCQTGTNLPDYNGPNAPVRP